MCHAHLPACMLVRCIDTNNGGMQRMNFWLACVGAKPCSLNQLHRRRPWFLLGCHLLQQHAGPEDSAVDKGCCLHGHGSLTPCEMYMHFCPASRVLRGGIELCCPPSGFAVRLVFAEWSHNTLASPNTSITSLNFASRAHKCARRRSIAVEGRQPPASTTAGCRRGLNSRTGPAAHQVCSNTL